MDYFAAHMAELEKIRERGIRPRLLLHSCCGPCSGYVLESLAELFDIRLFYYNPNIYPKAEYLRRRDEQIRLLSEMPEARGVSFAEGAYGPAAFYAVAAGHEGDPERGARCALCYALRMERAAGYARENCFDYFTTTLSISPHKDARMLNETGAMLEKKYGVKYLFADFKKKNGFGRSLGLSARYGLFRQEYCGCEFSMRRRGPK